MYQARTDKVRIIVLVIDIIVRNITYSTFFVNMQVCGTAISSIRHLRSFGHDLHCHSIGRPHSKLRLEEQEEMLYSHHARQC